ncbi:hypothetical protein AB0J82_27315 [Asanoa sp. NPDC049518]|uniref:hypothetical protein n=1 Tax=unclassified Asanoa TaxID=2685164 RepID=UPI00341500E5
MSTNPNAAERVDTEGKAVPPYDGRRESADVDDADAARNAGAKVGGATGPVEDHAMSAPDPDDTPGGATGSPADEQPASQAKRTDSSDAGVGPAHTKGTGRAEDA